MTLGEYLRLVLAGDPAIAAMVDGRVYSEVLPQKPIVPALVFDVFAGEDDVALDGPTGAESNRVQIDAWASKRTDATKLGRLVREFLTHHTGAAAGFVLEAAFLESEQWEFEPDTLLHRVRMDFAVHHSGTSV